MINYQGAIQAAAATKNECYSLATDAYNDRQPDTQVELYQIADAIQRQIEVLMEMEILEAGKYRTDYDLLK